MMRYFSHAKMKVKDKASVNVGRKKALETAKAVGGVAVFPVFAKGEVLLGKTNSARLNRRRILLTRDRLFAQLEAARVRAA